MKKIILIFSIVLIAVSCGVSRKARKAETADREKIVVGISRNAHVEKKKSKCDYILDACPSEEQVAGIEAKVNEVIASGTLRIVHVGDYDACACIGAHVANTSEIGVFKIISHDFNDGIWRLRWKVIEQNTQFDPTIV